MLEIAPAQPEDAARLATLEAACFDEAWSQLSLETSLADAKYCILTACLEGHICGYILGWNVGVEAEIARVAVLEAQRGQGVGEELVRGIVNCFRERGVREVFLEVRRGNHAAVRLYRRSAFEEIGCRPSYYGDGEDAVLMQRSL